MTGLSVLAGAASADITPPIGLAMGGYGARAGVSSGLADPLRARAVVLSDGTTELALVVCDLLGVGSDLVDESRRAIEDLTGIPPANVLVAATHTHSGPAGIRRQSGPDYVAQTAAKAAGAVAMAQAAMVPVRLVAGAAELSSISLNRRHPAGPIEDRLRVLVADAGRDRPPVFSLVSYACHSTVREHDNLDYSADWPGAMARSIEAGVGGTAVYMQGAAGDLNPVWSAHDHAEVERVGGIVGAAATRLILEMRPHASGGQWTFNLSWSEQVEVPATGRLLTDVRLAAATTRLEIDRRQRPPTAETDAELKRLQTHLSAPELGEDDRRRTRARINQLGVDRQWGRSGLRPGAQPIEVQALRLSAECGIVSLPGEFFVSTGRDIAARSGLEFPLIAGYANGSVGYVPPAPDYPEAGYEVGMTQFDPGAAEQIAAAAVDSLRSLYS
jgi:neutral ceramidase